MFLVNVLSVLIGSSNLHSDIHTRGELQSMMHVNLSVESRQIAIIKIVERTAQNQSPGCCKQPVFSLTEFFMFTTVFLEFNQSMLTHTHTHTHTKQPALQRKLQHACHVIER